MNTPSEIPARPRPEVWKTFILHGFFGLLLLMAYYFFKERLYADSAYYIFHSIDSGFFVTANNRIVLAISEIPALAAFYFGASLKTILVVWSVGHVLIYYLLFIIVYHKLRHEPAGIALILLQVTGQVWLYYSPMLEICYGVALLIVFFVLLDDKKFTPVRWFWLVVLEMLVLSSHPENFVLFFFVVMRDIFINGFRKKVHPVFFLVFTLTIVLKSLSFSEYEGGKLGYMLDPEKNRQYENLWNPGYLSAVWSIFRDHYQVLLLMFIVVTVMFLMRKNYLRMLLFLFTTIGLMVLINATNFTRDFTRYNESLYYPVAGGVVISFMMDFYAMLNIRRKNLVFLLLLPVFVYQADSIRRNGEYLKLRTLQMENLIDISRKSGAGKTLVRLQNAEQDRWVFNWSYPMESLLLSSIDGPQGTVSLIADEDYDYRDTSISLTPGRFILRRWEIREDNNTLPFFKVTGGGYQLLNRSDSMVTDRLFQNHVSIKADLSKKYEMGSRIFIPVQILNRSGRNIPSLPADENYFEINEEDGPLFTRVILPIDADIPDSYTQVVTWHMKGSEKPGRLVIRLLCEKKEIASTTVSFN